MTQMSRNHHDDGAALGTEVARRTTVIAEALTAAEESVDPEQIARARADLEAVRSRLRLGVDRTVVALVGGTGSGKSSLFNAISGLQFADVGALRPTTNEAAACVWGGTADELLDFLRVSPARRITRESVLDADREKDLHGLVLLDLPDHDSVATGHWEQVDRLLPLVDVLVWVVDPQKYADNALHEKYLRELAGRQESMLVLINQIDTVPPRAVEQVQADVRHLLAADGLPDVQVINTSATERTGIPAVRQVLAAAVSRSSTAARTAAAEVDAVASRLRAGAVGRAEPELGAGTTEDVAAQLAAACGTGAVSDSIRSAVADPGGGAIARPELPAPATVAAVRSSWEQRATAGLPPRWAATVSGVLPDVSALQQATGAAVAEVELPEVRQPRATGLTVAGGLLGVLAAVYVAVMLAVGGAVVWAIVPALIGVALAGACLGAARAMRHSAGARLADQYADEVHHGTGAVVEDLLAAPSRDVLERHRQLREALT